jgi:hypothetical protein
MRDLRYEIGTVIKRFIMTCFKTEGYETFWMFLTHHVPLFKEQANMEEHEIQSGRWVNKVMDGKVAEWMSKIIMFLWTE